MASPEIDAIWICGPNDTRVEHMRAIHRIVTAGRGTLRGVACEKPLGRNLAEAREMVRLAEEGGAEPRLPRKPGLRGGGAARQGDHLAARRAARAP
ncbi:MAG: Gfo/Idh/MocA family oxidoreductase [Thermomicrobiales bacterium]